MYFEENKRRPSKMGKTKTDETNRETRENIEETGETLEKTNERSNEQRRTIIC